MKYEVFITQDAIEDLYEIYRYIEKQGYKRRAKNLIEQIRKLCYSLTEFPYRGHPPPELKRIGVVDYLELHYKTYRIVYKITENKVYIHCVLDGRRYLQDLLEKRLLR